MYRVVSFFLVIFAAVKKLVCIIVVAVAAVLAVSCRKDNPVTPVPQPESGPSYRIIEGSYRTYRNCDFENIISAYAPDFNLPKGVTLHTLVEIIKSLKLQEHLKIRNIDYVLDVFSDTTAYGSVAMEYRSVDLSGKERWLSGRIFFQIDGTSADAVPIRCPDHLLLACHHTVCCDLTTPSKTTSVLESLFAQQGGLVVVPDCLGFGSTDDITHPYCHPISGRNSVDMLISAREYCRDRGFDTDSLPSYIEGYSQGGYSALACLKYICEYSLQDSLRLKGSVCGAGPYSHVATFDRYIDENESVIPLAVPYLMVAYKTAFPDILVGDYDRYLSEEVLDAGVVDIIVNRRCSNPELDDVISRACDPFGSDKYLRTDRILSAEAFERGSESYNLIMECCRRCDLTEGWTINTPVRFFHGADDDVVSCMSVYQVREKLSNEFTSFEILDGYPTIYRDITGICVHMFYGVVYYIRMVCGDYLQTNCPA